MFNTSKLKVPPVKKKVKGKPTAKDPNAKEEETPEKK